MEPANQEPFVLRTETLGALPIVNHFLDRIGLDAIIDRFLPANDARLRLDPAVVIGVLVRNLTIDHQPIYALAEWAAGFDPALFGLTATDVDALNDDRTGRMLDRLFDTDRASLITHTVLSAVREFDINMDQLHNDSTTVTFSGGYHQATGAVRGDKPTPAITYGHNKDHRPDLKQLLCVLTVSADGAVPVAFRVEDGNTADDPTHIPTWDELVVLVGRPDFLYVADSKLCNRPAMDHINSHGGRFVTILPRTRKEDRQFRDRIATIAVEWTEAHHRPANRIGEPDQTFHTTPNPTGPSVDGYRIIWVRSSTKTDRDAESRRARIAQGIAAIDDLNQKLVSPKTRMKTLVAVQTAADAALKDLRFPTEPSGHSPVTNPIDAGSFLATYFIDAASVANHFAWASEEVHKLYAAGRGFEERTHAHTVLYTMRAAHHRDVAPIPAHLALDHPYAGLASIHVDRADGVSTTDLDAWLDGDGRDVVLGGGSPVDQVLSWRPIIPDREGPMDLGSGPGGKDRSLLLCFLDQQVEEAWDHLVAFSEAIEAAGIARVALTAPFTPAIPGTDTYCDQLF